MRVDKSSMPNESESFNSYQLSSSFGRGFMHKGKRLLNLVRGIAFLVFVCAGSFLFCDIFNENADRRKTDPFSQQEKKL